MLYIFIYGIIIKHISYISGLTKLILIIIIINIKRYRKYITYNPERAREGKGQLKWTLKREV